MKLNPFSKEITKDDLIKQMVEKRPLPMGRTEFDAWSNRIISGAMVKADVESQKFALADMILHLGATEDHKEDAYFIKHLRKVAVNQVADQIRREIKDAKNAQFEEEARLASFKTDEPVKSPTKNGYYHNGEFNFNVPQTPPPLKPEAKN